MSRVVRVGVPLLLATLTTCSFLGGEDRVEAEAAGARLEQQRLEVRDAAAGLLTEGARRLGGRVLASDGRWKGCESAFPERYRNYRYSANGRVGAGAVLPEDAPDLLRGVLEEAGFTPAPGADPHRLRATRGDLTTVVAHFGPGHTTGAVHIEVTGPCVDVAEDEQDDWVKKREPTPRIV